MGSCAAPSAKGDDKFITTDYLQQCLIFRGRNGSQVKLLWSTGDGLCLLTKRLERGRFAWPSARDGKVFLTPAQLAMLLEGIDWRQPKRLLTSLTML
ncbi:transposase (plasmid) [Escherichia coli]|nr:transposase [Escherichia coli]